MKKIHLICNAHIDPVWQWTESEGLGAALSTFWSAVELSEEFDYIFCHNEAFLYEFIEKGDPELFARIRELVALGKWHIMGGWYLQPDCLMPSGESIVRQILVGKQYFQKTFGVWPTVAVNFDSFGHSRGLVQILKKCGQDGYLVTRPWKSQLDLPDSCFEWIGYDGSRVRAAREEGYGTLLGGAAAAVSKRIAEDSARETGFKLWGVGNHGGGPSRKDLAELCELSRSSETEIAHSTPEAYFSEWKSGGEVSHSLVTCMPGCYTSAMRLKHLHIRLEQALYDCEKICSVASLNAGFAYPQERFGEAVRDLLCCEFHDVLPGTAIEQGIDSACERLSHGISVLDALRRDAFFALTREQPPAVPGSFPIFVFSPHPYPSRQIVACELCILPSGNDDLETILHVFDGEGRELPSQRVKEGSNMNTDWRKKVLFEAELAPLGVTRFDLRTELAPVRALRFERRCRFTLPDGEAAFDPKTGFLCSYRIGGCEYLRGPAFQPFIYEDNPDPWGMSEEQLREMGKNPLPFEPDKSGFCGLESFCIVEDGALCTVLQSILRFNDSRIVMNTTLYRNRKDIDVDLRVYWNEPDRMLKLHLPVAEGDFLGQEMFGTEKLFQDGRECVAQRFVAVRLQSKRCLGIFNRGSYGCSMESGRVKLSLLRGTAYCAHPVGDRPLLREGIYVPRMDQGEHRFFFRMTICGEEELERNAREFCAEPYALNLFPHGNAAPECPQTVRIEDPNIALVCFKKSESEDGYVLRLLHNAGGETNTALFVLEQRLDLSFGPYEAKTVLYDGALRECEEWMI